MKYHSSLLKKYISVVETPEQIAKDLTLKTCEIEEIISRYIADSIVIGHVDACEKHPDADRLNVCQVNCGDKGIYQIICGGVNVRAGIFVPVALPGTVFAKAGMTIEKRKMRGIESNGMICSKEELDILEDLDLHTIWDLAVDLSDVSAADLGTPLAHKYPRLNSDVFEVDNKTITNRPDLTGHFGAAVELHTLYGKTAQFNKVPDWMNQFAHTNILETLEHATPAQRRVVAESDAVQSYTLMELNNVHIDQTSFFTRLLMRDLGLSPRNNWVDFSNLFMLLSGQPIHFFDADKVAGDIIVRYARDGEIFVDLFETTHTLKSTDLVIADSSKILALAGVVGGLESGVTESTKNILVEIANFDPVIVRKTGTRLALRTDAELRFEKSINPWWSMYCLLLFLEELKYFAKDLGSFDLAGIASYVAPSLQGTRYKSIALDFPRMEQMIFGAQTPEFEAQSKAILEGLGFVVASDFASVTTPIWRSPDDLNIQEDITEELVRIYGYDHVAAQPTLMESNYAPYSPLVALHRQLEDVLVQVVHADQTETYPWIGEKQITQFGKSVENFYSLQNPVNPEAPYMRDSLAYNLLGYAAKNSKFYDDFTIFDIGKIWKKDTTTTSGKYAYEFVDEQAECGVLLYKKTIADWSQDPLLDVKNILKTVLHQLGIQGEIAFEATENSSFHPKKQANIVVGGMKIGTVGSLHPLLLKEYKIPEQAGLVSLSLSLSALQELLKKTPSYTYETLQDQILWRDLCFVVESDQTFAAVLVAVKSVKDISEVEVFDLYQGQNLGEGKKSVSLKIKIVGDGNLTTEGINAIMETAIQAAEKVGAMLRK